MPVYRKYLPILLRDNLKQLLTFHISQVVDEYLRLSELRRDLQAKIGTMNVNINIGPTVENYGGETFLSQEVSINILQETKLAFKRCQTVGLSNAVRW